MTVMSAFADPKISRVSEFLAMQVTLPADLSTSCLISSNLGKSLASSFLYLGLRFPQLLPFLIRCFDICVEAIKLSRGEHIGKIHWFSVASIAGADSGFTHRGKVLKLRPGLLGVIHVRIRSSLAWNQQSFYSSDAREGREDDTCDHWNIALPSNPFHSNYSFTQFHKSIVQSHSKWNLYSQARPVFSLLISSQLHSWLFLPDLKGSRQSYRKGAS